MIILLTNDDGIKSDKLLYAKEVLKKYGTVYIVAPSVEQSAKGMALTIGGFNYRKIDEFTYSVEGTPVDCVNFALGGLDLRPDLVVSGINNGYNLGFDTKYSGTLGACFQAQYFGFKTIAFSSDNKGIEMVVKEFEKSLKYILDNKLLSTEYTLNVNFPRESIEESKGILHTKLFYQKYEYRPEIINNKYIPNRRIVRTEKLPKDSDAYAFRKGYTSISKLYL
jgi:5'-nucleotidase